MKTYNKFMIFLWLVITIVLVVFITYKSITEGFNRWGFMYIFAFLALIMYLMRKYMTKRMEKHMKYLEEQAKNKGNQ